MKEQFLAMIDKKIKERDATYVDWCVNRTIKTGREFEKNRDEISILQELRSDVEKMEEETVSKKDALDFAYWYHNGLTNRERGSVEEEFEKYMNETI